MLTETLLKERVMGNNINRHVHMNLVLMQKWLRLIVSDHMLEIVAAGNLSLGKVINKLGNICCVLHQLLFLIICMQKW